MFLIGFVAGVIATIIIGYGLYMADRKAVHVDFDSLLKSAAGSAVHGVEAELKKL